MIEFSREKLIAKEKTEQEVKDGQKIVKEINDDLLKRIKIVKHQINNHTSSIKTWRDIELIVPKLHELKDSSELTTELKTLEEEGESLIQLDKGSAVFVQNIVLNANAELSNFKTTAEQSIENLKEINESWIKINKIKNKIKSAKGECEMILKHIESPNNLGEAQAIEEKYNKALSQCAAITNVLPAMEEAVQKLTLLAENYPQLDHNKLKLDCQNVLEKWENHNVKIKENAEIAHSQQVIWKQVNEAKDTILQWLSDINIELLDCVSNFDDIEKIKSKLVKYSEEKELNLDLKSNLTEKIKKLEKLNGNKPVLTLSSLCELMDEQFSGVDSIASSLVGRISSYSQQEEAIRTEIKKRIAEINQVRENVIKCDNLNNELDALLDNLKSCQKCKSDLIKSNLNIDTINHAVSEMTGNFPILSESTVNKELKSLKKRYETVVQQVDKVETTLMTYLKKHLEDDLNNLLHSIKCADEKLTWCKPEEEIEKEQIEVKLRSVEDVQRNLEVIKEQKSGIDYVIDHLNQYSSSDVKLEELSNNNELLDSKLEDTEKLINERKVTLEKIISFWDDYQKHFNVLLPLINTLESDIKTSIEIPIDMHFINVVEENVNKIQLNVDEAKQLLDKLTSCVENIKCFHSKIILDNQVLKNKRRLELYQNSIDKCSERVANLKRMKKEFIVSYDKTTNLMQEFNSKLKSVESSQPIGKKSIQNAQSDLAIMKGLNKQLEECQQLVNDSISKGESMYPDINMENRDEIRSKIKELRSSLENLNDECGNKTKTIENALVQKSSFDESCGQIQNWLHETELKLTDCKKAKKNSIIDKRQNCNNLNIIKHDLIAYKNVIDQLKDKVTELNEPDSDLKLKNISQKYESLLSEMDKCFNVNKVYLKNHELYLENVEAFHNYHKLLLDEYSATTNNPSETDLNVLVNIMGHKSEGDSIIEKCKNIGSIVLKETDDNGKITIQNELKKLQNDWKDLMSNCEDSSKILNQKQDKYDEIIKKIENLDKYLKSIDTQIKDRSLKNSLATKQQYLEKLNNFDEDIRKKHKEILEIQSDTTEIPPDINRTITELAKTYQNVKTKIKVSFIVLHCYHI